MTTLTSEARKPYPPDVALPDHAKSHRQILGGLDQWADSTSDEQYTEDESNILTDIVAGTHADSLVGVSIGKAQDRLRSPTTPATEKAKALQESGHYFDQGPDSSQSTLANSHRGSRSSSESSGDSVQVASESIIPSEQDEVQQQSRPSPTKAKQHAPTKNRRRTNSGPTAILQNIKKILPDFSSAGEKHSQFTRKSSISSRRKTIDEAGSSSSHQGSLMRSPLGLDGNASSVATDDSTFRPPNIRRTTSDHSLYLRKAATGGSDFDDTTAFASIADMPNARFKAITDSLQDTSIRLPKILSSKGSSHRSNNSITERNTAANKGSSPITMNSPSINAVRIQSNELRSAPKETKHPILKEALSRTTGDLVIMGGYRGSVLRSAEPPHQQLWIPVKVGLNLRKVDLEVGLTHEDEERMSEKIIPSGILSHIGPIDISRRLLKKMQRSPQVRSNQLRVHDWGYDWRLSPHLLTRQLIAYLESLECNHPERPAEQRGALVIAHSLGGLITRHAVNQRPDLFSGVIYAGVPQNCINILGPLRNGDDVLLSSKVLTAQVNFTLRTSYALLPENGRCFLNRETGERYDVDFFDINTWDEYRLSPCINPPVPVAMRRKTLVGSISETLPSLASIIPGRKGSLFGGTGETSPTKSVGNAAEKAKDQVEDTLQYAVEHVQSPEDVAGQSLEPSMKSGMKQPTTPVTCTIPKEKACEYLARTLTEIKRFKQELKHRTEHCENNLYPPTAVIYGQGVPTVFGAKVASREAIKYSDAYDDLAFASGDGVVLASAAQLPAGYRCVKNGRVRSDRGHVGLLGDLEGIGQCIGAVVEGRRRGIGLGNRATNK